MPHLPRPAPIDAYGNGGFRFADMSHRGSILCLPDGIWAWPYSTIAELDAAAVAAIVERRATIDFFMLGTGRDPMAMPPRLRALLADAGVNADAMTTGAAVRTYNIMLGENRRVAAGLIAVP
jgi:uncharacterized protein